MLLRDVQASLAAATAAPLHPAHAAPQPPVGDGGPLSASALGGDAAHRRRILELDGMRKQLERRADEVEAAAKAIERERHALQTEYTSKISEMAAAKAKLEAQASARVPVCAGDGGESRAVGTAVF